MRRRLPMALLGLLVWVLAGCSTATGAATAAPGANQADITFSQQMVPHHQQSIQVANLAPERSASEFVKSVAAKIVKAEAAEVQTMTGWLQSWNAAVLPAAGHAGHSMPGMITSGQVAALQNLAGDEFDRTWLPLMAEHLRNGVTMAKTVLSSGEHPETKALAQEIVENQTAAIDEITARIS
ncbi:DUF305 domain-containing protein [Amycolatopsis regifaucium]|uniref:DUF305 domain-containing protein n=1 Tax=Amycolatopsis regifaucium TaxID=546365 RepID=A0A154MP74_9PSEU|nr:DUF305 domain-containing protein [Amycolatopsis regifaucium]KZB85219.1 DUF305 domain-containing protein [Amycolatopsis regifaucium]OKA03803.1 DUF305 domain-containing protein [Amycolatopsis regifaucium]SFH89917.1 Uncharacterized conserved protein, DUF305 family [Amycolatopsis regifaucium]